MDRPCAVSIGLGVLAIAGVAQIAVSPAKFTDTPSTPRTAFDRQRADVALRAAVAGADHQLATADRVLGHLAGR